jgi:hypothetical protein
VTQTPRLPIIYWYQDHSPCGATKKNPEHSTHSGLVQSLPQPQGFWPGGSGCRGMGLPLGLAPLSADIVLYRRPAMGRARTTGTG